MSQSILKRIVAFSIVVGIFGVCLACGGGGGIHRSLLTSTYYTNSIEDVLVGSGDFEEMIYDSCCDGEGGLWVTGFYSGSFSLGELSLPDISSMSTKSFVAHINEEGDCTFLGAIPFSDTLRSRGLAICRSAGGGAWITGTVSTVSRAHSNVFVTFVDDSGIATPLTIASYTDEGDEGDDGVFDICPDGSNGCIVAGFYDGSSATIVPSSGESFDVSEPSESGRDIFVAHVEIEITEAITCASIVNVTSDDDYESVINLGLFPDGTVWVASSFTGTASFGSHTATATEAEEMFLAELEINIGGSLSWSDIRRTGAGKVDAVCLCSDASGFWVAGSFLDSVALGEDLSFSASGSMGVYVAKFDPAASSAHWSHLGVMETGVSGSPLINAICPDSYGGAFFSTISEGDSIQVTENVSTANENAFTYVGTDTPYKMVVAMVDEKGIFRFIADREGGGNLAQAMGLCLDGEFGLWVAGWRAIDLAPEGPRVYIAKIIVGGWLYVWGANESGQIGNGNYGSTLLNSPVPIESMFGSIQAEGGDQYSLVLKSNGEVWAWGRNQCGQLGLPVTTEFLCFPQQITSLAGVIRISAGGRHCHALLSHGSFSSWGCDDYGSLGDEALHDGSFSSAPVSTVITGSVLSFSAGKDFSLLAAENDSILMTYSWGRNNHCQLGLGFTADQNSPVPIADFHAKMVSAARVGAHSLAIDLDGNVWAWGKNNHGQCGSSPSDSDVTTPFFIDFFSTLPGSDFIVKVLAGNGVSYALSRNGTVYAWGDNSHSQLGVSSDSTCVPTLAFSSPSVQIVDIAATYWGVIALDADGNVWVWGTMPWDDVIATPAQVTELDNVGAIGAGLFNFYAIKKP